MQSTCTRRLLDVEELATRQAVLTGFVEAATMKRLLQIATVLPPGIAYRIEFAWDASERPRMRGRVDGTVRVMCQRCLDELDWRVDAAIDAVIVCDESETAVGQDAVVRTDGGIMLEAVIEDELLLELPSAPVHPPGSCEAPSLRSAGETGEPSPPARANPFAVLEALREDRNRRR